MQTYRLTIGENGTPWGKQTVIHKAQAENAIEFIREYAKQNITTSIENCWVDAGKNTISISVANLIW